VIVVGLVAGLASQGFFTAFGWDDKAKDTVQNWLD
jgi:hypothetical protein